VTQVWCGRARSLVGLVVLAANSPQRRESATRGVRKCETARRTHTANSPQRRESATRGVPEGHNRTTGVRGGSPQKRESATRVADKETRLPRAAQSPKRARRRKNERAGNDGTQCRGHRTGQEAGGQAGSGSGEDAGEPGAVPAREAGDLEVRRGGQEVLGRDRVRRVRRDRARLHERPVPGQALQELPRRGQEREDGREARDPQEGCRSHREGPREARLNHTEGRERATAPCKASLSSLERDQVPSPGDGRPFQRGNPKEGER